MEERKYYVHDWSLVIIIFKWDFPKMKILEGKKHFLNNCISPNSYEFCGKLPHFSGSHVDFS